MLAIQVYSSVLFPSFTLACENTLNILYTEGFIRTNSDYFLKIINMSSFVMQKQCAFYETETKIRYVVQMEFKLHPSQ